MSAVSFVSAGTNTQDKQSEIGIFEKKELNHAPSTIEYAPDEILVKFKPGLGEDTINTMNSEYETSVKSTLLSGTKILNVPSGKTVDEMVKIYASLSEVEYAEPNYIEHAFMVPNDPYYSYQWHLDNDEYGGIKMESAWDISTGTGVVVAVIDTGVAYEDYGIYCKAPDLAGTTFVAGYDFVNNDAHPNDDDGHGTHVAGTIAQTTNNGVGVAGVAFDCSIMPIKTLNATGSGTHADFSNGVHYAVDHGADIISYSGGGSHSNTKEEAVEYAYTNGVAFVAAAGNEYQEGNPPQYPA
ncbi:peptidase S8, partial [ANME-1 cluster archaeon GoMg4]|nr:peptidase S8 [ANME-1 cluster archaeon GoMg4]